MVRSQPFEAWHVRISTGRCIVLMVSLWYSVAWDDARCCGSRVRQGQGCSRCQRNIRRSEEGAVESITVDLRTAATSYGGSALTLCSCAFETKPLWAKDELKEWAYIYTLKHISRRVYLRLKEQEQEQEPGASSWSGLDSNISSHLDISWHRHRKVESLASGLCP